MAFQPNFRMVRAEDQLVVDVALENMTTAPTATGGRLQVLRVADPGADGRLTLTFPPQQVLEYAQDAQGVRLFQPRPIFSPPSTVVLTVPKDTAPVPATVAGVLDLARRLRLVTDGRAGTVTAALAPADPARPSAAEAIAATRAATTGRAVDPDRLHRREEGRARREALVEPVVVSTDGTGRTATDRDGSAAAANGSTTAFALPYLATLRPPGGATRLLHAVGAVANGARFPLWTTTLAVADGGRTVETTLPVLFGVSQDSATKTAEWLGIVDDAKLDNAVKRATAQQLKDRTDPAVGDPDPATLRRLRLSSHGGWLQVDGEWTDPLLKISHSTAMGRDQSQLVVQQGFLFPFGFRATATSQTVRVVQRGGSRVAALHTESSILVDDPVAVCGSFVDQPGWPYRKVTCLTRVTGPGALDPARNPPTADGVETVQGAQIFTARNRPGGPREPFAYRMTAVDRVGHEVEFQLPLIFVPAATPGSPNTGVDDPDLPALWRAQGAAFTTIELDGQPHGMAPATAADEAADLADPAVPGARSAARAAVLAQARAETRAGGTAEPPTPEQATTVLVRKLRFDVTAPGKDALRKAGVTEATGIVPALDRVLPGQEQTLTYTQAYLQHRFADTVNGVAANLGKTFLEPVTRPTVALGDAVAQAKSVTGGLAQVALPIAAMSRKYGAVAGTAADIARGDLDLDRIVKDAGMLLGVVPLHSLFPAGLKLPIKDPTADLPGTYRLTVDVENGIATQDLTVSLPLFGGPDDHQFVPIPPGSFARLQPFREKDTDKNTATLTILQHTETDLSGNVRARTETTVTHVELEVRFDGRAVVTIPFKKAGFTSVDGQKPDPDIVLGKIRFGGLLELLSRLADLVQTDGFSDPPAVVVSPSGVTAGYSLALPSLSIGMFALENISFGAALSLSFTGGPIGLDLNFATPDNPFRVSVAMLGGGGSLAVGLSSNGLESVDGMLEFGASISVDLVVARAAAEVMGGVAVHYRRLPTEQGGLSAFLRIHGEVDILSLVMVSVDLLLTLDYRFDGPDAGKLVGEASVAVEVKTVFFTETVTARARQKFAGSNGDPTFVELMAPAHFPGARPWDLYCAAFSED